VRAWRDFDPGPATLCPEEIEEMLNGCLASVARQANPRRDRRKERRDEIYEAEYEEHVREVERDSMLGAAEKEGIGYEAVTVKRRCEVSEQAPRASCCRHPNEPCRHDDGGKAGEEEGERREHPGCRAGMEKLRRRGPKRLRSKVECGHDHCSEDEDDEAPTDHTPVIGTQEP